MFYCLTTLFLLSNSTFAQCPQLFDGNGNATYTPYWVSCTGGNFTLFIQSPDNIGAYTVDYGDGTPIQAGASIPAGLFISHTYAAATDTFVVTLTETATGCVITGVVVMEITPSASIQIPLGSPIYGCTPASFLFVNGTTNASQTTVFTWTWGDGTPIETYNYTNWQDTLSHTYMPGTTNCFVPVTLTAENYCNRGNPSINIYQPIQVWDIDNVSIAPSATFLCYPDTVVHLENNTNLNCYALGNNSQRYEYWNFGDYWGKGYDSIINWQPFSPPARPGYDIAYPGIGTYTVLLTDSSFCGIDSDVITINIVPQPTAGLNATPDTICVGQSIVFQNLSAGGANSFSWNFGDGSAVVNTGSMANRTKAYNTAGTFTVTLAATIAGGSGSCVDFAQTVVVVKPAPTAIFSNNNPSSCDTAFVSFTDASIDAVAWSWNFANGNTSNSSAPPIQFYGTPGNYVATLTVTSINGCFGNTTDTIRIYQTPVPAFATANVCVNGTAVFTDQSTSSPGDSILNWLWNFGDGTPTSNLKNPTHVYSSSGTYSVVLTVATAHCSNSDTLPITVNALPIAAFTANPDSGCTPSLVNMINSSIGANTYNWSFGDGTPNSASVSPLHSFSNPTASIINYSVSLIAQNIFGCRDTAYQVVSVYPPITAAFSSNAIPGCSPLPVSFNNNSVAATTYNWNFGDGSVVSNSITPVHTFSNSTAFLQSYTVTLTAISANGCRDSSKQVVTVFPRANISVSTLPNDTGCHPLTVNFNASSGGIFYQWDFGDGTTNPLQNPSHVFTNTGVLDSLYDVRLIVTNAFSCKDTVDLNILVHSNPIASFSMTTAASCSPASISFQSNSFGASSYSWNFGDGSAIDTTTNPSHIFTNTTSSSIFYSIKLITTNVNGCKDSISQALEVYPEVVASFAADSEGCSVFSTAFINQSLNASSYQWNFGDGTSSSSINPVHSYTNNTIVDVVYEATLIATSAFGCVDTSLKTFTVHPSPIAAFVASPTTQVYPSASISVVNNSNSGNWQYWWSFGDGTTSTQQTPSPHTYSNPGTYTITLAVSSAYCTDTIKQTIVIVPPVPIADFTMSDTAGCVPLSVSFTNTSMYGNNYFWSFGDGSSSVQPNPTHTYIVPGTYTVLLVVSGIGGVDSASAIVTAYPKPFAFFTVNPTVVNIPNDPLYCYNLSSDATSYWWDFGDSTTSTEVSPQHYYTKEGDIFITLIATNDFGCKDTFILPSALKVQAGGELVVPTAFTPNPSGSNGGLYDSQDFSNDIFFPFTKGIEDYRLTIYNRWGELIFESTDLKIGWDGYYKGKLCEQDVYVWKVIGKFINGKKVVKTGDVTLLR